MLYPMPKKIQFIPSQAKWQLSTTDSVLVLVGLQNLRAESGSQDTELMNNLLQISNRAKTLDIPIVDLYGDDLIQGMQQLGEYASTHPQLIFAGQISPMLKQIFPHLQSVTEQIAVVDDAISLNNQEQHIQWIDKNTEQGIHHISRYDLSRLWNLTAPSTYILSIKGLMLAVAEVLNIDVLEIDPYIELKHYGLTFAGCEYLLNLWRSHGANIEIQDFTLYPTLHDLVGYVLQSHR